MEFLELFLILLVLVAIPVMLTLVITFGLVYGLRNFHQTKLKNIAKEQFNFDYNHCFFDIHNMAIFINEQTKNILVFNKRENVPAQYKISDLNSYMTKNVGGNETSGKVRKVVYITWSNGNQTSMYYDAYLMPKKTRGMLTDLEAWLKELQEKRVSEVKELYDLCLKSINIPSDKFNIYIEYQNSSLGIFQGGNYLWKVNDTIHFYPSSIHNRTTEDIEKFKEVVLNIADIEYFALVGEISYEDKVSGGGGGVNIGGAIIGGLIAGEAGAIIGSRNAITIDSKHIRHDSRKVLMSILLATGGINLYFSHYDLKALQFILPEKYLKS